MPWTLEDRLLLHCCQRKSRNQIRNLDGILRNIDWDVFLDKARKEGVSPLIYCRLPAIAKDNDTIPPRVTDALTKNYYTNAAKNTIIFQELGKVLETFNRAGLETIILKGAALAELVYRNLALRAMSDVDLLVKKEDLCKIDVLLKTLGYFPSDKSVHYIDIPSTYLTTRDYRSDSGKSVSFHIHWHFVNSTIPNINYIKNTKMENIWQDAEKTMIAHQETCVMAPHHLLVHLSEHALRVTHSFSKLLFFCDIYEAIVFYRERLAWDRLIKESREFGLDRLVYFTLYFTNEIFPAGVPEDVLVRLRPARFRLCEKIFIRLVSNNCRFSGLSYLLHLSMNKGVASKIRFVARTFFPPCRVIAQRCGVAQKKVGLRFYLRRMNEVVIIFARSIQKIFNTG